MQRAVGSCVISFIPLAMPDKGTFALITEHVSHSHFFNSELKRYRLASF
jgi:hypothetical protein